MFALSLFLTACATAVGAQAKLLDKYRFEDGGYSFVGVFEHWELNSHPLTKKMGEFYTDDIAVLNSIKKSWVFSRPQHQYACGYHYYVMIMRNGVKLDSWSINLECKEITTKDGSRYFDTKKLESLFGKMKPLYRKQEQFASITEARERFRNYQSSKDFVYADSPHWVNFEGEFSFRVACPSEVKDCYVHGEKVIPQLQKKIAEAYPEEKFELQTNGGTSSGDLFVEVKSNKTLEEKFTLYDRWNKEAFGKWKAYPLFLYSYWKQPIETK